VQAREFEDSGTWEAGCSHRPLQVRKNLPPHRINTVCQYQSLSFNVLSLRGRWPWEPPGDCHAPSGLAMTHGLRHPKGTRRVRAGLSLFESLFLRSEKWSSCAAAAWDRGAAALSATPPGQNRDDSSSSRPNGARRMPRNVVKMPTVAKRHSCATRGHPTPGRLFPEPDLLSGSGNAPALQSSGPGKSAFPWY
jgi:hypothetical protein